MLVKNQRFLYNLLQLMLTREGYHLLAYYYHCKGFNKLKTLQMNMVIYAKLLNFLKSIDSFIFMP